MSGPEAYGFDGQEFRADQEETMPSPHITDAEDIGQPASHPESAPSIEVSPVITEFNTDLGPVHLGL